MLFNRILLAKIIILLIAPSCHPLSSLKCSPAKKILSSGVNNVVAPERPYLDDLLDITKRLGIKIKWFETQTSKSCLYEFHLLFYQENLY